ncbi:MAG: prepilin-type N-terminal cleavage/methylation domain-containing protein [Candidatus Aminicenantes bacterium]|nr:prepilin-type N-terminal cleavage/methylation domain-containing protein [Candidatus Aminicenantes bacterium]
MLKKERGFTLIELLIVVAIIGFLSALLIPNAITAIQKAKQTSTMKDIKVISTAIADYVTDNGSAPAQDGTYDTSSAFYNALSSFYVKVIPLTDKWGNRYYAYCGSAADGNYGVTGAGADDFLVASYGRDKTLESFSFAASAPEAGFFSVSAMVHFDYDLVMWNGSWIRSRRTAAAAGT